jgi:hypothetical protein
MLESSDRTSVKRVSATASGATAVSAVLIGGVAVDAGTAVRGEAHANVAKRTTRIFRIR